MLELISGSPINNNISNNNNSNKITSVCLQYSYTKKYLLISFIFATLVCLIFKQNRFKI